RGPRGHPFLPHRGDAHRRRRRLRGGGSADRAAPSVARHRAARAARSAEPAGGDFPNLALPPRRLPHTVLLGGKAVLSRKKTPPPCPRPARGGGSKLELLDPLPLREGVGGGVFTQAVCCQRSPTDVHGHRSPLV